MKKVLVFLLITVFLSSCSMTPEELFLIPTSTLPPTQVPSNTPTDMPTFTPTVPTLTYTPTPTLLGFKSATPTPPESSTPTAFTPFNMITPDTLTPSVVIEGFVSVFTSGTEFYKKGCEPGMVKITGQVAKPLEVNFVVLFVRFKSKLTGNTSEWTSIGMQSLGAGTYTHDLKADEMKADNVFENAWVEYQLVATNLDAREKGRTAIFSEKLTLLECAPTATPTIQPTATVLKP
jgi:hypothetical protein